ncbi:hypothetical protein CALCODRAFT_372561 [Calocera cornea HHB12733]|uniref:Uncharacterized protein n=1 Tax=Calocera cornea HHB12733 TaxID=1353952 RepID=A0A165EH01_9BASI|nr:hypothetical protein CALCODRAFT_372561 [Calocera cornea HHB12733]
MKCSPSKRQCRRIDVPQSSFSSPFTDASQGRRTMHLNSAFIALYIYAAHKRRILKTPCRTAVCSVTRCARLRASRPSRSPTDDLLGNFVALLSCVVVCTP